MKTLKHEVYGIVSDKGEVLAVYLDKVSAEMQLQYFKHRTPRIIIFKGESQHVNTITTTES